MIWRNYLKAEEIERIAFLNAAMKLASKEKYRIYDRCRQRKLRAEAKSGY